MEKLNGTIDQLWDNYSSYRNEIINGRYLCLETIENVLGQLPKQFNLTLEGRSVNKRAIYSVCFGKGKTKILMWSQMHGNETTTTKAVFDLLKTVEFAEKSSLLHEIISNCTIKIIPVLNPDGAECYTRENANKTDLNRDAKNLSEPESRVLAGVFEDFAPDFCFNLHDQRSIYSAGNFNESAVVSFLAPSFDKEKTIHGSREISMQLLAKINNYLQKHIPNQIGRYDDSFNDNCVGDKFQSLRVPTVLFEAGQYALDYQREETRKLIYIGLMKALESISTKNYLSASLGEYTEIPENKKLFFDVIVRNVRVAGLVCDVGIQYEEQLKNKEIIFVPFIEKIGDLSLFYGHKELEGNNEILTINSAEFVEKGAEIKILTVGNENISLKLC